MTTLMAVGSREWQQELGRVPLLIAEVGAGRVTAITVPAGFIF